MHMGLFFVYYFDNLFLHNEKYKHLADQNVHQMNTFSLLGGEGDKQGTENGKIIMIQILNDIRLS